MHKLTFHWDTYLTYDTYSLWQDDGNNLPTGRDYVPTPAYDANMEDDDEENKVNELPEYSSEEDVNQEDEGGVVDVTNDDDQRLEDLINDLGDTTVRRETTLI